MNAAGGKLFPHKDDGRNCTTIAVENTAALEQCGPKIDGEGEGLSGYRIADLVRLLMGDCAKDNRVGSYLRTEDRVFRIVHHAEMD